MTDEGERILVRARTPEDSVPCPGCGTSPAPGGVAARHIGYGAAESFVSGGEGGVVEASSATRSDAHSWAWTSSARTLSS
ncbi:hypothetical protein GCM10010446_25170 [Streptomyces enissocaesilis]|uniref:Uncharacterized protein n=1 Tax=Streptomyces enissocaesilis TaxID=332589 RepID=A0ABP6JPR7_9ACTN